MSASCIDWSQLGCRDMQAADIDALLSIERHAHQFCWGRQHFSDCLQTPYLSLVLEDGSARILGYAILCVVFDEAQLLNIVIDPQCQGRGLGAALLQMSIAKAMSMAATYMLLEVRPSNARALALYRQTGFSEVGLRKNYYQASNGREDALLLRLDFAA